MSAHSKHHDQYDCNPEGKGGMDSQTDTLKAINYSNGKENSTIIPHAAGPWPPYMGKTVFHVGHF